MKPCDICLEKVCKSQRGEGNCVCEACAVKNECNKKLRATIRITLKCTQSCSHCCFDCSPKNETHMSVEMAKNVAQFLISNEVYGINLMGGEIFCNPNWKEILDILIPATNYARIVTNGDWSITDDGFAEYISKFDNCYVCVSKDRWHTNKNIEKAEEQLTKHNIITKVSDLNEKEFSLVPIGRAEYTTGLYSMFGCYCNNPEHHYSFLINESGDIFKCGFGVWDYANINDYLTGGFASRFKEFNKIFYDTFIGSCSSCIRSYNFKRP